MTKRSQLLIVLMAVAATSTAQTPAPTDAPASPPASMASDNRPRGADARACLEFPTRVQVIACANKYLPRRAAAKTAG